MNFYLILNFEGSLKCFIIVYFDIRFSTIIEKVQNYVYAPTLHAFKAVENVSQHNLNS